MERFDAQTSFVRKLGKGNFLYWIARKNYLVFEDSRYLPTVQNQKTLWEVRNHSQQGGGGWRKDKGDFISHFI